MMKNFRISQEYSNNERTITVKFDNVSDIKDNQLKMLLNNDDISGLVPAKFLQTDGVATLYYNVGQMPSFAEKFANTRMTTGDFVTFVKSFSYTLDELESYLLSSGGILTDSQCIFYDPAADSYKYIFVPTEYEDLKDGDIIRFFSNILNACYENTGDQFAQEFLSAAGSGRSLNDINRIINKYDDKSILGKIKTGMAESAPVEDEAEDVPAKKEFVPPFHRKGGEGAAAAQREMPESKPVPGMPKKPELPKKKAAVDGVKKPGIKNTETKTKEEKKTGSDPSSVKRVAFIAAQVVALAIVAKVAMSGIDITKVAALVVLLIVVDVVVARDLFFKNKGEKPVKEKKEKAPAAKKEKAVPKSLKKQEDIGKKEPAAKEKAVPPRDIISLSKEQNKPQQPAAYTDKPAAENPQIPAERISKEIRLGMDPISASADSKASQQNKEMHISHEAKQEIPASVRTAPAEDISGVDSMEFEKTVYKPTAPMADDIEMAKTVLMTSGEPMGYIEVYDKNDTVVDKYIITDERTVIGRLKSQVNLQIKDLMVGKIHAEIVCKDHNLYVRDICSLNGTYIGDMRQRIKQDVLVPVNSGETIYLAEVKIKVYCI